MLNRCIKENSSRSKLRFCSYTHFFSKLILVLCCAAVFSINTLAQGAGGGGIRPVEILKLQKEDKLKQTKELDRLQGAFAGHDFENEAKIDHEVQKFSILKFSTLKKAKNLHELLKSSTSAFVTNSSDIDRLQSIASWELHKALKFGNLEKAQTFIDELEDSLFINILNSINEAELADIGISDDDLLMLYKENRTVSEQTLSQKIAALRAK